MKGKNKPDNLEKFFQRVLGEFEEDPGEAFWDRIAPIFPLNRLRLPLFIKDGC